MSTGTGTEEPTVELDDDLETIQAYYELRGWSDGLPIIPPTVDRVERFVGIIGRDPAEVVCTLAPRNGEATIGRIAANAVMAGCRPEDFPLVVAAVEAVADPALNLNAIQSTTHPTAILLLLSGPAAQKAGIVSGPGCFGPGPGLRGNLSIGRALRLVLLNIGGGSPGDGDRATQGSPAKIGYCIAENVEESPWAPYHTDHGYKATDSVLTAIACEGPHNIQDHYSISGTGVLTTIAGAMAQAGSNNILSNSGFPILALGPEHAHQIAVSGYAKADVQQFIWEHARFPLSKLSVEWMADGAYRRRVANLIGTDATDAPITTKPENIQVIVAGGPGKHSCWMPTFGGDTRPVHRLLEF